MVDAYTVDGPTDLVETASACDLNQNQLSGEQFTDLWDLWELRADMFGPCVLVAVQEWFASDEFGALRPFVFAQIEHDDPSSGAVLFADAQLIDISIVRGGHVDAIADADNSLTFGRVVTELDISDSDDYIDESGKAWIPRSLMTVFEFPDDMFDTAVGDTDDVGGRTDPSRVTGGVLGN